MSQSNVVYAKSDATRFRLSANADPAGSHVLISISSGHLNTGIYIAKGEAAAFAEAIASACRAPLAEVA